MIENPVVGMKVMPVRDAVSWSSWFVREVIDKGVVLTIKRIDYTGVSFYEKVTTDDGLICWNTTSFNSLKQYYIEVNPCPMEVT